MGMITNFLRKPDLEPAKGEAMMTEDLAPGTLVQHPSQPDWGLGQVQSVIGERVTVNFEHAGKVLINAAHIKLEVVSD